MDEAGLTCQELVELITEYWDDALPAEARRRFEAHLRGCEGCQAYVDQLRHTLALTGELRVDQVPPTAQARLLDVFRDWRAQPGAAEPP